MEPIKYVCPKCQDHSALNAMEVGFACPKCKQKWGAKDGVPLFTEDRYWGELPEKEMLELIAAVKQDGFGPAMADMQKREPGVFQFCMDPARADWRFGMEMRSSDTVLDVGCGMGGITFGLCDSVERVVSFDLSWARAKFVQLRSEYEGKKNIQVFAGDFMESPLPEGSFDVIVFNGILEWVGQSMKFGDPYEVQKWVMKKCLRLLKPGGRMYVGIENRFNFGYLFGPDHIGLSAVAWMPRWLARPYCKFRIGKDYRTYTHSKPVYVKLFREAGFRDIRVLMPFPGYNNQKILIPFDDTRILRYAISNLMGGLNWRKKLMKMLSGLPGVLRFYRYFFFSYDIYGVKPTSYDAEL